MTSLRIILFILLAGTGYTPAAQPIIVSEKGPFHSIYEARNEIRTQKKEGKTGPFTVLINPGIYPITNTFFLGNMDSDTTYRADQAGTVRFTGGTTLDKKKFKRCTDTAFLSRIVDPEAAGHILTVDLHKLGITDFGQPQRHAWGANMEPPARIPPVMLYIGGKRMQLARWPNQGVESPFMVYKHFTTTPRPLKGYELKIQSILDQTRLPGEVTLTKVIDPGDIARKNPNGRGGTFEVAFDRMKYWHDIENVWLDGVLASTWEWSYNRIKSVDSAKKQITLAHPELNGIGQGASVRLPHFYFENIPEELDAPGEFWIDRAKGLLYLYPPENSDGAIVLATLDKPAVTLRNASNVRFQGLEFDTGRNVGFLIEDCDGVVIDQCRIANFIKGGVDVDAEKVRIINSQIHGLGAYGVRLKGGDLTKLEPAGNEVVNCHIHDFGWEQKSQQAGICAYGVGHRIAHNTIHDATHFAILIRRANDVIAEYNEIYDLPKYHRFDGGSFYIGTGERPQSRGLVVRNNYFHDIPTIGVYPDNFSWGVEVSGNVFRNVGVTAGRPPINVNGGGECRSFNNLMIDCVQMYWQGARAREDRWFDRWDPVREKYGNGKIEQTAYRTYPDFKQWLTYQDKEQFFRPVSHCYNNVLYHPHHEILREQSTDKTGIKDNSAVLDKKNNWATQKNPGLVDYANGDYRLKPTAAVFKKIKGFQPIPFEKMGRLPRPVE
jgi:hypothetical protein